MSFDFATVKPVTVKAADVPTQTRTRAVAENPLAPHFAASMAKENAEGFGTWKSITLPIVNPKDGSPFGDVYREAFNKLSQAASNAGKGLTKKVSASDDGTEVTIYFRSKPRGTRTVKDKTEESKA